MTAMHRKPSGHITRTLLLPLALPLAPLISGASSAPAQEVTSQTTDPSEIIGQHTTRGTFGKVAEPEGVPVPLAIEVKGHGVMGFGDLWLVEPGLPVTLTASLEVPPGKAEADGRRDLMLLRQTAHLEVLWQGEADDQFSAGTAGTAVWRSGTAQGKASYVTATAAQIALSRTPTDLAAPEAPVPATLYHGKKGVLLLSGVAYDRNGDGLLYGQNIGIYPDESGPHAPNSVKENAERYRAPVTFYRIDERSRGARINDHMTLGLFQPPVFEEEQEKVRFVAISPRLLEFLPALFENMEERGMDPDRLAVLRAFVSPTERQRLERAGVTLAEYTRHQYGDALAIVYTDPATAGGPSAAPRMGDLTGDSRVDIADAEILAALVKETMEEKGMFGGLGVVGSFKAPGVEKGTPHVQFDLRGFFTAFRED